MNQVGKARSVSRYRILVIISIGGLLLWMMMRYFSMMEASIESMSYHNNLEIMSRLFFLQQVFAKRQPGNPCDVLDNPKLFGQTVGQLAVRLTGIDSEVPAISKKWEYDAKTHQLTYFVRTDKYFRSPLGQRIVITLICNRGDIKYQESPHQWCVKIEFWGCERWY